MISFSWSESGTLAPEWFTQSTHHLFFALLWAASARYASSRIAAHTNRTHYRVPADLMRLFALNVKLIIEQAAQPTAHGNHLAVFHNTVVCFIATLRVCLSDFVAGVFRSWRISKLRHAHFTLPQAGG